MVHLGEAPRVVGACGPVDAGWARCVVEGVRGGEVTFAHRPVKVEIRNCSDLSVRFAAGCRASVGVARCQRVRVTVAQAGCAVTLDDCSMCFVEVDAAATVFSTSSVACAVSLRGDETHALPACAEEVGVRRVTTFRDDVGWSTVRAAGPSLALPAASDERPPSFDNDQDPDVRRRRKTCEEEEEEDDDDATRPLQWAERQLGRRISACDRLAWAGTRPPCVLLDDLLLSDFRGVSDPFRCRAALGVTHVLNLAAGEITPALDAAYARQGITLIKVAALDEPGYDIFQHLDQAIGAYAAAKEARGKLVVHCVAGVNRSGALATALYMLETGTPLLEAAAHVNRVRGPYLTNRAFARQLVAWARDRGLVEERPPPGHQGDRRRSAGIVSRPTTVRVGDDGGHIS